MEKLIQKRIAIRALRRFFQLIIFVSLVYVIVFAGSPELETLSILGVVVRSAANGLIMLGSAYSIDLCNYEINNLNQRIRFMWREQATSEKSVIAKGEKHGEIVF